MNDKRASRRICANCKSSWTAGVDGQRHEAAEQAVHLPPVRSGGEGGQSPETGQIQVA